MPLLPGQHCPLAETFAESLVEILARVSTSCYFVIEKITVYTEVVYLWILSCHLSSIFFNPSLHLLRRSFN